MQTRNRIETIHELIKTIPTRNDSYHNLLTLPIFCDGAKWDIWHNPVNYNITVKHGKNQDFCSMTKLTAIQAICRALLYPFEQVYVVAHREHELKSIRETIVGLMIDRAEALYSGSGESAWKNRFKVPNISVSKYGISINNTMINFQTYEEVTTHGILGTTIILLDENTHHSRSIEYFARKSQFDTIHINHSNISNGVVTQYIPFPDHKKTSKQYNVAFV